jgi:hypothetical protein
MLNEWVGMYVAFTPSTFCCHDENIMLLGNITLKARLVAKNTLSQNLVLENMQYCL